MKFSIKDFFSNPADLVTFTEEIHNGNGNFIFCAEYHKNRSFAKAFKQFLISKEQN